MSPGAETVMSLLPWGLGVGLAALLDRLRAYEPRPAALADNLQWATVAGDGLIQNRDGALSRTWRYRGLDTRVASAEELTTLSTTINLALCRLGSGVILHFDAVRRPVEPQPPGAHFPHRAAYLFDLERYQRFGRERQFETEFFLTLTMAATKPMTRRFRRLFVVEGEKSGAPEAAPERFDSLCQRLEGYLGKLLRLERLETQAQLAYFHHCLTGLERRPAAPAPGELLGYVLSDQEFHGGWKPRVGDLHLRVVRVQAYPTAETRPALLDPLTDLPCAYRWSTRLLLVTPAEADQRLKNLQWMWFTRRHDARSRLRRAVGSGPETAADQADDALFQDGSARAMAEDSGELLRRLHAGEDVLTAFTTKIVIFDSDPARAEETARQATQALAQRGFGAALETANPVDAWLGSLPAHGSLDLRRDPIPSRNAADLLPMTGSWPGEATVPSRYFPEGSPPLLWAVADGATPFRFQLHCQDVMHGLILGPTGAGKSYLTAHLALQFLRYPAAQVVVFDKGYSSYLPCLAVGGAHYDLASPHGACQPLQPLRRIDEDGERAWAVDWLDTLLRLQGLETRARHRNALARALDLLATEAPEHRTLEMLRLQLPDPELQGHLAPYCGSGPLASLLDGDSDPLEESHFACFELGHILDAAPQALVPVQLYLAHALGRRRSTAKPTLMIWDEAWRALEDPYCRSWIKSDLATARKQNCGVVLVTQSLAQIAEPDLRTLIDEAAQTKIFLPNPGATQAETQRLYEALGLTPRLCEQVAAMTPKRDYLYASRLGVRVFRLGSTSLAEALLSPPSGSIEESQVQEVRRLRAEHPSDWLAVYLRRRGFAEWADRLSSSDLADPSSKGELE